MPTYKITHLAGETDKDREFHPVNFSETCKIEALNISQAFNHLDLKIGNCSIQLISGSLERWNNAKDRFRKAYRKNQTKSIINWRDFKCASLAHEMDDVQLLEAIAEEAEWIADIVKISYEQYNIEICLSDTYLLAAFYLWRMFSELSLHTKSHCSYCDREGDLVKWEISLSQSIQRDVPKIKYVCLNRVTCWKKALDDGYKALSNNRRKMVKVLLDQGKTQRQIRDVLRVSQSTITKDMRILKREQKQ